MSQRAFKIQNISDFQNPFTKHPVKSMTLRQRAQVENRLNKWVRLTRPTGMLNQ